MTDLDAIEYLEDLKKYNRSDKLITPQNKSFDTFFQCAFDHAIRALKERIQAKEEQSKEDPAVNMDNRILSIFQFRHGSLPKETAEKETKIILDAFRKHLADVYDNKTFDQISARDLRFIEEQLCPQILPDIIRIRKKCG